MFDLEDLQTFVEVADAGGVSPAARRLGVSKSIVSRRLCRLEAELGIQLLARTTRGAALTEAGVKRFKVSSDPEFEAKVSDVVGLYMNPPDRRWCSVSTRRARSRRSTTRSRDCRSSEAARRR